MAKKSTKALVKQIFVVMTGVSLATIIGIPVGMFIKSKLGV